MADQSTPPPNVGILGGKSPSPAHSPPGVAPDPIEVLVITTENSIINPVRTAWLIKHSLVQGR